jgi:hypothetical protein
MHSAFEVSKALGAGFLEKVYERARLRELRLNCDGESYGEEGGAEDPVGGTARARAAGIGCGGSRKRSKVLR